MIARASLVVIWIFVQGWTLSLLVESTEKPWTLWVLLVFATYELFRHSFHLGADLRAWWDSRWGCS